VGTDVALHEVEVLEGQLVAPGDAQLEPPGPERLPVRAATPALQTAVAAATGFVAGAATVALLRRYGQGRLERAGSPPVLAAGPRPVRTYVVTVRSLG
jgi:hypothetical protein